MSNYLKIKEEIKTLAQKAGRSSADVTLVVVSKGHPWEEALPLYNEGCRDFGENRLQEALEKKLSAPDDIRWHMIGTLQSNKVKKALSQFVLIHSVDTPELALKIDAESQKMGLVTSILLQVNTSGELSKHGLSPENWLAAFEKLMNLPNIQIVGLMAMAPLGAEEAQIRACFSRLRKLRDQLEQLYRIKLPQLSMGMSQDYRIAIEEGATLLRIGTAVWKG